MGAIPPKRIQLKLEILSRKFSITSEVQGIIRVALLSLMVTPLDGKGESSFDFIPRSHNFSYSSKTLTHVFLLHSIPY